MTDEMTAALQAVRVACEARAAKAVDDFKARLPAPVDRQAIIDAAQAEDVAAVNALAAELSQPAAEPAQ